MNKEEVVALVRKYAQNEEPVDVVIEVLDNQARPDGDFWYIPVRTDPEMPKRYKYYEKLVDIEHNLHDKEQLDVLLVPAG